mgnify:CR=1 FL=1
MPFRSWAATGKHVIISSHVLQEVDVISDQVVLIANGMIVAEGRIREVRDEMRQVAWPSRAELINYTSVVLTTLILLR